MNPARIQPSASDHILNLNSEPRPCPVCGHGAHCVAAGNRKRTWRCDSTDCRAEFRVLVESRVPAEVGA
ncbi:hypothetical protein [Paludisphaera sp.]|uniref:hypothetical protein n=1 Tax=Paludisphaera sp. TaxID=2017432 RepID=UPI00301C0F2F